MLGVFLPDTYCYEVIKQKLRKPVFLLIIRLDFVKVLPKFLNELAIFHRKEELIFMDYLILLINTHNDFVVFLLCLLALFKETNMLYCTLFALSSTNFLIE